MTVHFSHRLNLSEPDNSKPSALMRLAEQVGTNEKLHSIPRSFHKRPAYPPRTIDSLLELIKNGLSKDLSILEWIHLIVAKTEWDERNSEMSASSSRLIWDTARTNHRLRRILFFRLVHYFSGREHKKIATSLASTYASHFRRHYKLDELSLRILDGYSKQVGPKTLARESESMLKRPEQVIEQAGLPVLQSMMDSAYDCVVDSVVPEPSGEGQIDWLIDCLNHMGDGQQVKSAELILTRMREEAGSQYPNLLQWMKSKFNPRSANSKWSRLSDAAQLKLRDWLGFVNYADFENLINNILEGAERGHLSLEWHDKNRLSKRKTFWRQYSSHFKRIRALFPHKTLSLLLDFYKIEINNEIEELVQDGANETEVCIFDFEKCFIAEFFRGNASEITIYPHNQAYNEILFGHPRLSVNLLRALGGTKLDHVFLWQCNAEKILREEWKIFPNDNVQKYFQIDEKSNRPYNRNTGIQISSANDLAEREKKFARWREGFADLEHEAVICCRSHPEYGKILKAIGV